MTPPDDEFDDYYYGVRPRGGPWPLVCVAASVLVGWGGALLAIAWRVLVEGALP